jgi:mannose-1-phosphate guanylyltransferase
VKAMLLAAGKGTRVRPVTYSLPKPMIPLVRKPVMESIIEHLRGHGVDEFIVNTSHLAPVIESYFRDGAPWNVQIAYSFEGELVDGELQGKALGSAGGLKRVQEHSGFFDETFLVLCADALIDLDISNAIELHRASGAMATIVLKEVPREEVVRYGVVEVDDSGQILQFQEKPALEDAASNLINTGIYIFEPEILDLIPSGVEYDIGGDLFPQLVEKGVSFHGVELPFQWVDIGSVPDLWQATRMILHGEVNGYEMPGREVQPGVWVGLNVRWNPDKVSITAPVYIGSSSTIHDGATIAGPTVIGPGCVVEGGARLKDCVIGDYTRVREVADLEQRLVFFGVCIDPEGVSIDLDEAELGWLVDDARKPGDLPQWQQLLADSVREAA